MFWLLLALGLALAARHWVWMPTLILGESMGPTLHPGQLAGINRLAYHFRPPRRGEVVAIRTRRELMVKRIVGLPGEEIAMRGGVFYINEHPLAEPYVRLAGERTIAPGRLGPNRYVVAGDCRSEGSIVAVVSKQRLVGPLVFWQPRGTRPGGGGTIQGSGQSVSAGKPEGKQRVILQRSAPDALDNAVGRWLLMHQRNR